MEKRRTFTSSRTARSSAASAFSLLSGRSGPNARAFSNPLTTRSSGEDPDADGERPFPLLSSYTRQDSMKSGFGSDLKSSEPGRSLIDHAKPWPGTSWNLKLLVEQLRSCLLLAGDSKGLAGLMLG